MAPSLIIGRPALAIFAAIFLLIQSGCSAVPGDAAFRAGKYEISFQLYKDEFRKGNLDAGLRLAAMYSQGLGTTRSEAKALSLYSELAEMGVVEACHNLGVAYEYGKGASIDYNQAAFWYKRGADAGYLWSVYNLGTLYANQRIVPKNDIEGLALLLQASVAATGNSPAARFIANDGGNHIRSITARMSVEDIARARRIANNRPKLSIPKQQ